MRSRSHGLWVGPYAECSVERAHRELVHVGLAEDHHAGVAQPAHHGRVVRRPPALEDPRPAGRRDALGGDDVLERERYAGQRAELLAGAALRVDRRAAARAPSASTCRNAWTSGSTASIRSRCASVTSTALVSPPAMAAAVSAAVSRVRSSLTVTPPRRGCAGRGTGRPRRRGAGERLLLGEPGRAPRRGACTLVSGSACEVGGMSAVATSPIREIARHDRVELPAEAVELVVVEGQPGEPGEVGDLVAGDRAAAGHARGGSSESRAVPGRTARPS